MQINQSILIFLLWRDGPINKFAWIIRWNNKTKNPRSWNYRKLGAQNKKGNTQVGVYVATRLLELVALFNSFVFLLFGKSTISSFNSNEFEQHIYTTRGEKRDTEREAEGRAKTKALHFLTSRSHVRSPYSGKLLLFPFSSSPSSFFLGFVECCTNDTVSVENTKYCCGYAACSK